MRMPDIIKEPMMKQFIVKVFPREHFAVPRANDRNRPVPDLISEDGTIVVELGKLSAKTERDRWYALFNKYPKTREIWWFPYPTLREIFTPSKERGEVDDKIIDQTLIRVLRPKPVSFYDDKKNVKLSRRAWKFL